MTCAAFGVVSYHPHVVLGERYSVGPVHGVVVEPQGALSERDWPRVVVDHKVAAAVRR